MGPFESTQIHDFNPGDLNPPGQPNHFPDGGLFWTRDIPGDAVTIHPGRGDAHLELQDLVLFDYFNVVNAVFRGGPNPRDATLNVDIHWLGTGEKVNVENDNSAADGGDFAGQYRNATAVVDWSATNDQGYFFSTKNSSSTVVTHAFTARMRSGLFHG